MGSEIWVRQYYLGSEIYSRQDYFGSNVSVSMSPESYFQTENFEWPKKDNLLFGVSENSLSDYLGI